MHAFSVFLVGPVKLAQFPFCLKLRVFIQYVLHVTSDFHLECESCCIVSVPLSCTQDNCQQSREVYYIVAIPSF